MRRFEIEGSTRWTGDELRAAALADFEGRAVTAEELEAARRRLTRWYVDHGYISTGAVLPDQNVTDGIVRLRVIEGWLAQVEVVGSRNLEAAYVAQRLLPAATVPLDVNRILERLRLLQDAPAVERVRATLGPGEAPASATLSVRVDEAPALQGGIVIANNRSPSVGAVRAQLFAAHRSLTGVADPLGVRYGVARGLDDFGVEYARPVWDTDTTLGLRYDVSDAVVIEAPFSDLDIRSKTRSTGLTLARLLHASTSETVTAGISLDRLRSETSLLGVPFSFSPGVVDGRSVVTAVRLWQELARRSAVEALALRFSLNAGLDALGATISPDAPDSRFLSFQGQAHWARRVDEDNSQIVVRSTLQWSRDPLLPVEKLSIGGLGSVRGYRENLLVRDQGVVASVEWRRTFAQLPSLAVFRGEGIDIQMGPFMDFAVTSNRGAVTPAPRRIGSVGFSLWASQPRRFAAELHFGYALRRIEPRGDDIQDRGIHFRLVLQTP